MQRVNWLHIVVTINQNRGGTRRRMPLAEYDRVTRCFHNAYFGHADRLHPGQNPLSTAAYISGIFRLSADTRDLENLNQFGDCGFQGVIQMRLERPVVKRH